MLHAWHGQRPDRLLPPVQAPVVYKGAALSLAADSTQVRAP